MQSIESPRREQEQIEMLAQPVAFFLFWRLSVIEIFQSNRTGDHNYLAMDMLHQAQEVQPARHVVTEIRPSWSIQDPQRLGAHR